MPILPPFIADVLKKPFHGVYKNIKACTEFPKVEKPPDGEMKTAQEDVINSSETQSQEISDEIASPRSSISEKQTRKKKLLKTRRKHKVECMEDTTAIDQHGEGHPHISQVTKYEQTSIIGLETAVDQHGHPYFSLRFDQMSIRELESMDPEEFKKMVLDEMKKVEKKLEELDRSAGKLKRSAEEIYKQMVP